MTDGRKGGPGGLGISFLVNGYFLDGALSGVGGGLAPAPSVPRCPARPGLTREGAGEGGGAAAPQRSLVRPARVRQAPVCSLQAPPLEPLGTCLRLNDALEAVQEPDRQADAGRGGTDSTARASTLHLDCGRRAAAPSPRTAQLSEFYGT